MLQKAPENAKAWLLLGRVSLATSQYADAVEQFQRAEARGADTKTLAVPMAKALLGNGRYDEVIGLIAPEKLDDPDASATLWAVKGDAYRALERNDDAAHAYAQSLEVRPGFAKALVGQAQLAAAQDNDARAQELLDQAMATQADYAPALEARGTFAFNKGNCDQAEKAFKQVLAQGSDALPLEHVFLVRAYLSECLVRRGQYGQAQSLVDQLMKQGPANAYSNYLQALLDVHNKNFAQATTHLQQVLKTAPNNVQALTLLASVKISEKDPRLAEVYLQNALASSPGNARPLRMLAALYMRQKETPKAIKLLQDAHAQNPDNPTVRAMLAEALARSDDEQAALAYVQPDRRLGSTDRGLQMDLARAMAKTGNTDAALTLLGQMKSDNPSERLQTGILEIRVYLQKGQTDKALATAQSLVDAGPNDPRLLRVLAATQIAAGHDDEARKILTQTLAVSPDDIDSRIALGQLALRGHDYDRAEKRFQEVLSTQPNNIQALVAMARTGRARGDIQAVSDWLQKAHKAAPDNQPVTVALVEAYIATGKADEALPLVDQLVSDHADDPDLRRLSGVALLAAGQNEAAMKSFRKAVAIAPGKPVYRLDLARAELAQGNAGNAIRELKTVRENHPDYLRAVPALAMAQLQAGQPDAALATAADLAGAEEGGEVAANTLKGDIFSAQGDYMAAAKAYAKAYAARPSRSVAMNLFLARQRAGLDQPQRSVVDWLKQHPGDLPAQMMVAQWFQQHQRLAEAAEHYQAVLAKDPQYLAAMNNLALVYHRQGNADALSLAKQAFAIAPDNPAVIDTLGWITAENGEPDRGLELIRQAVRAAPSDQNIAYHLAAVLSRGNDADERAEARQILAQLLDSKQSFESRDEAQTLADDLAQKNGDLQDPPSGQ